MRIDKWLWAARLMKTRPDAADAVTGGKVHLNGRAVKPSRDVAPGDELEITRGPLRQVVVVRALAEKRRPAKEAVLLYEETPESVAARELYREQQRWAAAAAPDYGGRPTTRDLRQLRRAKRGR